MATKKTIGKKGREVNDLRSQLREFSIEEIIDSFDDENYKNFLRYVRGLNFNPITNFGTLIEKAKLHSQFEQYFSAGITKVNSHFRCPINKIPKGLVKLCRNFNIRLDDEVLDCYKQDPDFFTVAFNMQFNSLSSQNITDILTYGRSYNYRKECYDDTCIHKLHFNKNYSVKALLTYLDNLYTYEALESVTYTVREFYDYVTMMSKISPKYEKYPRNFLTSHKIAVRNYNRLKEQFEEEDFAKRIDLSLEYAIGDYKIIYPKSTQDIKDEAVQQNHCVASYIKRVIDKECDILFLRNKYELEKSLITLEIRNNKVVQARGKFNRDPTQEEQLIINKYNEKLERMKIAC